MREGILTVERLCELLVTAPRNRFGIPLGADFSLWRLSEEFTVDPADFLSMGRATPFAGKRLCGVNYLTVYGGNVVYKKQDR